MRRNGHDGDVQAGAPPSYTNNGDGTVTDNRTGLMWEVLSDDGAIHDWNDTYTWTNAFGKVQALNTASFAGHNDWRLPNVRELQSLVDFDRQGPSIDPVFHASCAMGCAAPSCACTTSGSCWTSTTSRTATANAWYVSFGLGVTLNPSKGTTAAVRVVRGGD